MSKQNNNKNRKKRSVAGASIVAVLVLFVAIFVIIRHQTSRLDIKINGIPVSEREYLYYMNSMIYDVTMELGTKTGTPIDRDFWSKSINGIVPSKQLTELTIDRIKQNRAIYELAYEKGYVDSVFFEDILKRMDAENNKRKERINNNQPVYGLSSFSEQLFIEYETDSFQKAYCENPGNEGMNVSDDDRQKFYLENRDKIFKINDDIIFSYVLVPYDENDTKTRDKLYNDLISLFKQVDNENGLRDIIVEFPNLEKYFGSAEVTYSEYSVYSRQLGNVLDEAYLLNEKECSQVIDNGTNMYIIQCEEKSGSGYEDLENVKDIVNKYIREANYERLIEDRAKNSLVEVDIEKVKKFTQRHVVK